jgi:hypothetical protein
VLAPHTIVPFGRRTSWAAARVPDVSTTRTRIRSPTAPVNVKQSSSPAGVIAALVGGAPKLIAAHADSGSGGRSAAAISAKASPASATARHAAMRATRVRFENVELPPCESSAVPEEPPLRCDWDQLTLTRFSNSRN